MKVVFTNIPMKRQLHAFQYKTEGNMSMQYDGEVIFPINAILAKSLKSQEKIKVVLLSKMDKAGNSAINCGIFQKELNEINRNIGANIEYVILTSPFEETKDTYERLFKDMIQKLEKNAEIFADVTYGPKPLPFVMFTVLNFAERFFNVDVKNIVYGKVEFVDDGSGTGKTIPVDPVLYDLVPLYYLNALTNTIECKDEKDALKTLDTLLDL